MQNKRRREELEDRTAARTLSVALFVFAWMLALIFRLAWLQIVRHDEFVRLAAKSQRKELRLPAPRGEILDRNGHVLAHSVFNESLYADLRMLKKEEDRRAVAEHLAPVLGVKQQEVLSQLSGGEKSIWLKRGLPTEVAQQVRAAIKKHRLSALALAEERQRDYPNATLAAHVIGSVSSDERGLEGLERKLDGKLRGTDGKVQLEQDALGNAFERVETPATSGARIVTTLDSALQHRVEVIVDSVQATTGAKSVTAIVLNVGDGEVLALANAPTFNPNDKPQINEARRNRAITDAYEPGSVFKLVTYAGALEEGLARPEDKVNCQGGVFTLGKHVFHDSHAGLGTVTVAEAFAKSSNVGAIKIALRLGQERLYNWIKLFGFNQRTGLELPGEVAGFLRPVEKWKVDSIGALAIGQELRVTPLQTVAAYAAVANGGVWNRPHLVKQVVAPGGSVLEETKVESKRIFSERVAEELTAMMRFVVAGGTGRAAGRLAGYTAAGKTGTPEKYVKGVGYKAGKFTPTFVGFVPATSPRFAIIVLIDEPKGAHQGGQIAAPAFNLIAEAALTDYVVPPDDEHFRAELAKLIEANEAKEAAQAAKTPVQAAPPSPGADRQTIPQQTARTDKQPPRAEANVSGQLNSALPMSKPGAQQTSAVAAANVMPDLTGQSLRNVMQACAKFNLHPRLIGSGQAVRQVPRPGTPIKPGETCQVEFH
jgi:cell division protein FtsI/penicillin-binding protein 2